MNFLHLKFCVHLEQQNYHVNGACCFSSDTEYPYVYSLKATNMLTCRELVQPSLWALIPMPVSLSRWCTIASSSPSPVSRSIRQWKPCPQRIHWQTRRTAQDVLGWLVTMSENIPVAMMFWNINFLVNLFIASIAVWSVGHYVQYTHHHEWCWYIVIVPPGFWRSCNPWLRKYNWTTVYWWFNQYISSILCSVFEWPIKLNW